MDERIVIDTREQKPLWQSNTISHKLDAGDYSIEGHEDKFAIERKSAMDLYGTLGNGNKRFKLELERAQKLKYFAIVIEAPYYKIFGKKFPSAFRSKMKGPVVTSILFTLHVKYGINIFFSTTRTESKQIIKELMKAYLKQEANNDKLNKVKEVETKCVPTQ